MEKVKNRNIYVIDIETLKSCWTYTAINIDTEEKIHYVLHKNLDQRKDLYTHLMQCRGHVTFNGLNFDYPNIHYFLINYKDNFEIINIEDLILKLYQKAQELINNQSEFGNFIKEQDVKIKQLDLFKIWHYNNKARSTSLKGLEISMNYPNVMDMPIHHSKEDITLEEVNEILEYNLNDVLATYEFYKQTVKFGKIDLRKAINAKYGLNCFNWNNGKIGEELILKLYCDKLGLNKLDVKKLRTNRESINLVDCIPNKINFKSKEFNELLNFFKSTTINETKGAIDKSAIYKGIKYVYGTGGVHAAIKSGVYLSDDTYIIKSLDVASLYPNIPIVERFYPEHLGIAFLDVYENDIVNIRLAEKSKPKELQDKSIVDGYKEAANIPYGKSNDENSFLYDPLYSMKTTIAGQLFITMLCERLCDIQDSQMLMVNTDGCEIRIPRSQEYIYDSICRQWESETKLVLEFTNYSKMWIRDINNYGCIDFKGKIKNKGAFEVDKVIGNEPAYHKDNSFKVIPLALQEYFSKGTPIEQTIKNHKNIYDFCGRQRFIGQDYGEVHYSYYDDFGCPTLGKEKLQKNVRYYLSNKGVNMIKKYAKGSNEFIHKGFNVTIFNKYEDKSDYDVNYNWYIRETQKEIDNIIDNQLTLF